MNKLFAVYQELRDAGAALYRWRIPAHKATTLELDGDYAVFIDPEQIDSLAEELWLLAHEAGHVMTGTTHKVYSALDLVERHEERANRWAIRRLIPREEWDAALGNGYTEPWELAEYFNLPEHFILKAAHYYQTTST